MRTQTAGFTMISRRSFVQVAAIAGGGLVIGLSVRKLAPELFAKGRSAEELFEWIRLAPDNTATLRVAQVEMGQGTNTTMAQLLAEELELDWSTIKTEFVPLADHQAKDHLFGRTDTLASLGVHQSHLMLRIAGAQLRQMLLTAAAQRFGVPVDEIAANDSIALHRASGRHATYADLASAAVKIRPPRPSALTLKDPKNWKIIGRALKPLDLQAKVDGSARYGIDVQLPGMLHAAILSSPRIGGTLKSYDASVISGRPGVLKVLEVKGGEAGLVPGMNDGIAVIANNWWRAKSALDLLPVQWDPGRGDGLDSARILEDFRAVLGSAPVKILRNDGDAQTALASAAKTFDAEYFVPLLEHATMEPMNATALVTDDRFEIWAPTQRPEHALQIAAAITGLPASQGEIHVTLLGGGFGRRQNGDFVSQAVQIAKQMKGTPVKLTWSREETMRHSFYRPASLSRLRGGWNAGGDLIAWTHRIVCQSPNPAYSSFGADSLLYAIPNFSVDLVTREGAIPLGPMRSISYGQNCFPTQCFADEVARAAGKDSYRAARALLDPAKALWHIPAGQLVDNMTTAKRTARLRAVLDLAAAKSDWDVPASQNQGRGIATEEQANSYFACVATVTLDGAGWFKVDRVVIAVDAGHIVNPVNARAQIEGAVAYGLSAALYGEINLRNGSVVEGNFDTYPVLRLAEMPEVDVHFIESRGYWGGVGEPATAVVMPAIANAIYDAGGPRIRSLPLAKHKIMPRTPS